MFGKLREKLKSFIGGKEETPKKESKKTKKTTPKKTEKKTSKKEVAKKTSKKVEKKSVKKAPKKQKIPSDEELKKEAEEIKEEVPVKFEVGELKYEPDTDEIREGLEELEKEKPKKGFFGKFFGKKEDTEKEPEETSKSESNLETEETVESVPKKEAEESKSDKEKSETVESEAKIEKTSFLKRFTSKLSSSKLTQEHVDEIFEPLEIILLENNVALEVVDKIKENLSKELVNKEVKKSEIEKTITDSLKNSIEKVLIEPPDLIKTIKESKKPYVIIFFGINGSGKTTSVAKLAHKLKENGISTILAAGDTFRAAAIQQLETHGEKLGIKVIKHDYGADPTAVAFDAKKYAEKNKIDCVLIDTAGRMYTKENLIKQMEKIIRVIQPDLKIFVGESITGNDGTEQAKTFNEAVGIDGVILSKADVDEKGGTMLSVSYITNKPIYFIGTGQKYENLEVFNKKKVMENLGLD